VRLQLYWQSSFNLLSLSFFSIRVANNLTLEYNLNCFSFNTPSLLSLSLCYFMNKQSDDIAEYVIHKRVKNAEKLLPELDLYSKTNFREIIAGFRKMGLRKHKIVYISDGSIDWQNIFLTLVKLTNPRRPCFFVKEPYVQRYDYSFFENPL
jgi:hypothetical protein